LEVPEVASGSFLGGNVASASDVDDGSRTNTRRKEEGGKLDEVDGLWREMMSIARRENGKGDERRR
jgi:hypothetical protein